MDQILQEHNQATRDRCGKEQLMYLIQDTTEVDLTKPKEQVEGVGPLGTENRVDFFYHPLYAINGEGVALGCVDQIVWTRDPESTELTAAEKKAARKQACFEEKESCRKAVSDWPAAS